MPRNFAHAPGDLRRAGRGHTILTTTHICA